MKMKNNKFFNVFLILFVLYLLIVVFNIIQINSSTDTNFEIFSHLRLKNDPFKLVLNDVLITVRTCSKNHKSRLKIVADTWYKSAKSQIYAVTDKKHTKLDKLFDGKLIATNCSNHKYTYIDLCCKFGTELNLFFNSKRKYKWFCHFDDDNYLNVNNLVNLLSKYNHKNYYYIGKNSWDIPVIRNLSKVLGYNETASFWFATLGAGICMSNATMYKIKNYSSSNNFAQTCLKYDLPDDMLLGLLLEWNNKIKLTRINEFHSHLETIDFTNWNYLKSQISLGYGHTYSKYFDPVCKCNKHHIVMPKIKDLFTNNSSDPFKIRSLHCILFPSFYNCSDLIFKVLQIT